MKPCIAAVSLCIALSGAIVRADDKVKESEKLFKDKVASILEHNCVRCHSDKTRKGKLNLSDENDAMKGGDSGEVIIAGDAAASLLVEMISGDEPKMPSKGDKLTKEEVAAISDWINKGAGWPAGMKLTEKTKKTSAWWSLQPLARVEPPKLEGAEAKWARTPIDAFALKKMREKGLSPSPEADPRTLIRRLYFDLLGMPPTPQAVEAFVKACEAEDAAQIRNPKSEIPNPSAPSAYAKLVDELLASPHYGERWARHWLDVVHYGDTHGYDKDKVRPNAWPYRDYVIRAFNEDKPFAQFVREQLAGDVLYPGTQDGIVALGFVAAGPFDWVGQIEVGEGTIEKKRVRNIDRDDMVRTAMETFTSTTVGCARCHDHKFDPISQEDYYSLQAVFAAVDRADRPYDVDPSTTARRHELQKHATELSARLAAIQDKVNQAAGPELAKIDRELESLSKSTGVRPEFGYHSGIEAKQDVVKWVQVDLGKPTSIDQLIYVACHDDFNGIGAGFGFPVRYRIEISDDPAFAKDVTIVVDHTKADIANPKVKPQSASVGGKSARYVRMTATKLAPRQNDFIFALAEMMALTPQGINAAASATVTSLDSIEAPVRWARKNLVDGYYFGAGKAEPGQIVKLNDARRSLLEKSLDGETRKELTRIEEAIKKAAADIAALPRPGMVFAAASSFGSAGSFVATGGKPRPVFLLQRGSETSPVREVSPGTLGCISSLPSRFELSASHAEGERRAALAKWIVDPKNPLTWRSIVNRMWHYHFGRGIVDSPNDFGRMGGVPSHPELLDWLAMEFRGAGTEGTSDQGSEGSANPKSEIRNPKSSHANSSAQSFKALHRLIVTSAVYRQASSDNPANAKIDAGNQFLWRQNRRKLDAESVRDSVLVASGKLNPTLYGPGFRAFGFKDDHSPHYLYQDHDPDDTASHRRSIYRFIVRSVTDPFMDSLDCADPSLITERRNETLTALQALALLNNKFMVRMSEHFAARVEKEVGAASDMSAKISHACASAFGRAATNEELATLVPLAQKHGLANVCRLLFNANEFVFVD